MADEDAQGQNSITVFIMGFFLSENSIYLDPFGSGVGPLTQVSHEDRSHQICQTTPFFSGTTVLLWIALPDEGQAKRR